MRRPVDSIGEDKPSSVTINILQSMRMANYVWRNATEIAIKNSFSTAGL